MIVDDTKLVVAGTETEAEGFEAGLGAVDGARALRRPAPATRATSSSPRLEGPFYSVTATPDTLMLGFGLEQLESDAAREEVVARMLAHFAG